MLFESKENANATIDNESSGLNILKLGLGIVGGIITIGSAFVGKRVYDTYKYHKSSEELLEEVDSSNLPEVEEEDGREAMKKEFEGILDYIKDPQNKDVVLVIRSTSGAIQRISEKWGGKIDDLPYREWRYARSTISDIETWVANDLQTDYRKIREEVIKNELPRDAQRKALTSFIRFSRKLDEYRASSLNDFYDSDLFDRWEEELSSLIFFPEEEKEQQD